MSLSVLCRRRAMETSLCTMLNNGNAGPTYFIKQAFKILDENWMAVCVCKCAFGFANIPTTTCLWPCNKEFINMPWYGVTLPSSRAFSVYPVVMLAGFGRWIWLLLIMSCSLWVFPHFGIWKMAQRMFAPHFHKQCTLHTHNSMAFSGSQWNPTLIWFEFLRFHGKLNQSTFLFGIIVALIELWLQKPNCYWIAFRRIILFCWVLVDVMRFLEMCMNFNAFYC